MDGDGEFSPDILNCQAHDLWPPARRCERVHRPQGAAHAWIRSSRPALLLVAGRSDRPRRVVRHRHRPGARLRPGGLRHLQAVLPGLRDALRLAQLGMAESLYYFVPRQSRAHRPLRLQRARRCWRGAGLALHRRRCTLARTAIAAWLSNAGARRLHGAARPVPDVHADVDGARDRHGVAQAQHLTAAVTYAVSDIVRTLLFVIPALAFGSLRAVFIGATVFAGLRLVVDARRALARVRTRLPDRPRALAAAAWPTRCRSRWPSASRSSSSTTTSTSSPSRFDAATFAIYAVGCLQIPLVDLIVTSTVNVLMVQDGRGVERRAARRWRCGTTRSRGWRSSSSRWRCCLLVTRPRPHRRPLHVDLCGQRPDLHGVGADDPAVGLRRGRGAARATRRRGSCS